jgi:hypothetical protein
MTHLFHIKPLQKFTCSDGEVVIIDNSENQGVFTVIYQMCGCLHELDMASFSAIMTHVGLMPRFHTLEIVLANWLAIPASSRLIPEFVQQYRDALSSIGCIPAWLDYAHKIVHRHEINQDNEERLYREAAARAAIRKETKARERLELQEKQKQAKLDAYIQWRKLRQSGRLPRSIKKKRKPSLYFEDATRPPSVLGNVCSIARNGSLKSRFHKPRYTLDYYDGRFDGEA